MKTLTPETDAQSTPHIGFYSCATVPSALAKKLEGERNELIYAVKIFLAVPGIETTAPRSVAIAKESLSRITS